MLLCCTESEIKMRVMYVIKSKQQSAKITYVSWWLYVVDWFEKTGALTYSPNVSYVWQVNVDTALRLMCLLSVTMGGLQSSVYTSLKTQFAHVHTLRWLYATIRHISALENVPLFFQCARKSIVFERHIFMPERLNFFCTDVTQDNNEISLVWHSPNVARPTSSLRTPDQRPESSGLIPIKCISRIWH